MVETVVAVLLAHQPLPDQMRLDLIEDRLPLAKSMGYKIAANTGNDTKEYMSVASEGLVEAVNRLNHNLVPKPENHGLEKWLSKNITGFTYRFMRRDRVVWNYQNKFVDIVPDEYIDLLITDVHDFLDDLVSLVTKDPNIKEMLLSVGRGENIKDSAAKAGLSKMQATRVLQHIRKRYKSQL